MFSPKAAACAIRLRITRAIIRGGRVHDLNEGMTPPPRLGLQSPFGGQISWNYYRFGCMFL